MRYTKQRDRYCALTSPHSSPGSSLEQARRSLLVARRFSGSDNDAIPDNTLRVSISAHIRRINQIAAHKQPLHPPHRLKRSPKPQLALLLLISLVI